MSAEEKERVGTELVRRFFAGLEEGDCDELGALLTEAHTEGDCQELVHELGERGVALVEVAEATVDGRDANAVILKVRIRDQGHISEMVLRAVREEEGWKLKM